MNNANGTRGIVLGGLLLLIGAARALAQDWPQWRGANRDSKVTDFTPPKTWPKALTQKWTATVGTGVSSPDLVGDKLYAFGRIGGDEATTCVDAKSGKVIWQDKYPTQAVGGAASGYGGTRSTPAVGEGKVCSLGVNGTVSCLDAASGKVLWRKNTAEKPQFNTSSSPLIADGLCVVFIGALTAYDLNGGTVKWKGPTGTAQGPYGSPALMTVDGSKQIVTPTATSLVGVSLADGKVLWQTKLPPGGYFSNYGTPIIDGQTVIYVAPSKGGGGTTMALKIDKKGDGFTATEVWRNNSAAYMYNTPVLKDGLLFGLSAGKTFFCMDAATGKTLWTDTTPRGEAGGVLNAGSVILALTGPAPGGGKGGKGKGDVAAGESELVAFEPSKAGYKEVAKYKLSVATGLAYPIVTGNRVYVKGNNAVTLWTIE